MVIRRLATTYLRKSEVIRSFLNLPHYQLASIDGLEVMSGNGVLPIVHLHDGYIWGNQGTVLDRSRRVVRELSREFEKRDHALSIFLQFRLPKPQRIEETVAILATSGADVYYHWMIDLLPRLYYLQLCGVLSKADKIYLNYTALPFQQETFEALDISEHKIRAINDFKTHMHVRECFIPGYISNVNECAPQTIELLKKKFLNQENSTQNKKLYLPRNTHRTIINAKEIECVFEDFGFATVYPDSLTIKQQAELFNQAAIVAGPHGSAFTNIVFCQKNTTVIELFSPLWTNQCFRNICNHVDQQHFGLIGFLDKEAADKNPKAANFYVDKNELIQLLKKAVTQ